jgi:hypothetical protein
MNASQLQALNDLIRRHVWCLEDISVGRVEDYWMVKIISDNEENNYQIDCLGLIDEFEPEF